MPETLLEMTKALVLAQIEAQHVTPDNLQTVLHSTYDALYRLQAMEGEDSDSRGREPRGGALSPSGLDWKTSISKHAITCLECGDSFKQLSRRHLQRHGLDSKAYRVKYGIPSEQPLSARVATARRRQLAKSIRPWERAQAVRHSAKRASGHTRSQAKLEVNKARDALVTVLAIGQPLSRWSQKAHGNGAPLLLLGFMRQQR